LPSYIRDKPFQAFTCTGSDNQARTTREYISLHFNSHFPGGPELAGTRMSPFWIILELRVMEVVITTGAIRCAKLQSRHSHAVL